MESHRGVASAAELPIRVLVVGGDTSETWERWEDEDLDVTGVRRRDGAARLADAGDEFDCVVVIDGDGSLDLIEAAAQGSPGRPVVFVTEDETAAIGSAYEAGATAVLRMANPANHLEQLHRRIRALVVPPPPMAMRNGWIDGLTDVTRRAITGSSFGEVSDLAVTVLHEALEARCCAYYTVDDDGLRLAAGRGWPAELVGGASLSLDDNPRLRDSLAGDGPLISEAPDAIPVFTRPSSSPEDIAAGVTVSVGPPDEASGVLGVYFTDPAAVRGEAVRAVNAVGTVLSAVAARYERLAELERYERIVETIDDGIYTLDDEFRITWVNQAAVSMLGYAREDLIGSHALLLTSEDTIDEAAQISQELLSGERRVGRLDTVLRTADGEELPIETLFTMLPLGDGRFGQVGVFRDITARKEYERVLTALHDSTRQLVRADTPDDVVEILQATATELLDLSTVVYRFDRKGNVLEPSVASATPGWPAEGVEPVGPKDDAPAWHAFVDQESVTATEPSVVSAGEPTRYIPLGQHGVFAAPVAEETDSDTETTRLTRLLVANAAAALDRIDREEELRRRERERQRQNRRLKQLNRINEIIRGIDQTLVQAQTREEIEQAVCDQLVRDDRYGFVWIGSARPGRDEITPRVWAGAENGFLDAVSFSATRDSAEPTGRAAYERRTVMVSDVAAGFQEEPWRMAALSHDYLSVVSVPLAYGDISYGVLTVYAEEPESFDEVSEAVFGELGETIAYAINSLETKQSLLSDRSVELDLRIAEEDELLLRMARAAGCRLEFREFVPVSQSESTVVFAAVTTSAERILGLEDQFVAIDGIRHVTDLNGMALFEARIRTSTVATAIKEYGAVLQSIVAEEHELRVVLELPRGADVRAFVERLQQTIPATELVGRRNRERTIKSGAEFRSDLEAVLTERQLEVLRSAYRNGYFEWPRERTGEEVATGLGISQPTFNRHLRESERKLFTLLFDDDLSGLAEG